MARRVQEKAGVVIQVKIELWWKGLWMLFKAPWSTRLQSLGGVAMQDIKPVKSRSRSTFPTYMVCRVEGGPKLVDPSWWINEGVPEQKVGGTDGSSPTARTDGSNGSKGSTQCGHINAEEGEGKQEHVPNASEEDMDVLWCRLTALPRTGPGAPTRRDASTHRDVSSL